MKKNSYDPGSPNEFIKGETSIVMQEVEIPVTVTIPAYVLAEIEENLSDNGAIEIENGFEINDMCGAVQNMLQWFMSKGYNAWLEERKKSNENK